MVLLDLVKLAAIATNLFWFGRLSADPAVITEASVGGLVVVIGHRQPDREV